MKRVFRIEDHNGDQRFVTATTLREAAMLAQIRYPNLTIRRVVDLSLSGRAQHLAQ